MYIFEFSKLMRAGEKFSAHQEVLVFEKWAESGGANEKIEDEDEDEYDECGRRR